MALVGKRTAAAGGADATVTTVAGIHGVIDTALIAAGWSATTMPAGSAWIPSTVLPPVTQTYARGDVVTNAGNRYQCIQGGNASTGAGPSGSGLSIPDGTCLWRFLTKIGDPDKLYTSTGESGNELLTMRVWAQTVSGTTVNVSHYQYWDGTFGYNSVGVAAGAVSQHTFTAGNVVNYALVADKDNFMSVWNDSANNRRLIGGGLLTRTPGTISTFFVSNATVTAGANKTFSFASGNPIASGYKKGDRVFVVSQQGNASSPFDPTIPLYAAKITALTTSSMTIDVAAETTNSGALIGAEPMPLWFLNNSINNALNSGSFAYTNYRYAPELGNLYTAGTAGLGYLYNGSGRSLVTAAAAELDPNNRTSRVVMGEHVFVNANNEISGIIPKYYWNPRTTDALWTIGRSTKEASNFDYVTFPANTAAPSGQVREMVGPFAISGSAGFTIDLYKINTDTWIQAEIDDQISDTCRGLPLFPQVVDRAFGTPIIAVQGPPFQGETSDGAGGSLIDTDGNVFAWALYMPNLVGQGIGRTGLNQYGYHAAEPLPFDSPEAKTGGTGSAFNSGFN
jgi:hypothetical protein